MAEDLEDLARELAFQRVRLAVLRHRHALLLIRARLMPRQLPPGRTRPPSWLGHRDACPTQWHEPCDCDLPPRTTPCTCRYKRWSSYDEANGWSYQHMQPVIATLFVINPRCHHHGDRARHVVTVFKGFTVTRAMLDEAPADLYSQIVANRPAGFGFTRPQPAHDDTHNPYDLDTDERRH